MIKRRGEELNLYEMRITVGNSAGVMSDLVVTLG